MKMCAGWQVNHRIPAVAKRIARGRRFGRYLCGGCLKASLTKYPNEEHRLLDGRLVDASVDLEAELVVLSIAGQKSDTS